MELLLWFQRNPSCELLQVQFKHPNGALKTSYRGKRLAFQRDAGLFQWSAAVKAFARLAVGTRAAVSTSHDPTLMTLEGEGGSQAAALDYAVAKPTSWIVDLFGRESGGKSYARLVFKRENSERKRPGPVRVALSTQLHDPKRLRIFLDGVELLTAQELLEFYDLLSTETDTVRAKTSSTEKAPVFQATWFKTMLEDEVRFSLQETELLDRLGVDDACDTNASTRQTGSSFVSSIRLALLENSRSSPLTTNSSRKQGMTGPCRVACAPTAVGALTLFHQLHHTHDGAIAVNASFPSTRAIIEAEDFDAYSLVVLSWGAANLLYGREGFERFRPVMLLPRTSLGLVLRRELSSAKQVEKVLLGTEADGYPMKFLASAQAHGYMSKACEPIPATFSEIMSLLQRKGDAAIAAFPLSHLIARRHGAKVFWGHDQHFRCGDNILFARYPIDTSATADLMREAWYTALENPAALTSSMESIFSAIDFTNYLYRLAALYQLKA